jgi:plasmid stabilization system protein ParE
MTVIYNIRHTESSERDLLDILRYIATELKEPATALRMVDTIDKIIESLSHMPHRCPLVDDERLAALGYRKLHVKNYIAFFTIDELKKTIYVERILYARRDWLHIL